MTNPLSTAYERERLATVHTTVVWDHFGMRLTVSLTALDVDAIDSNFGAIG